MIFVEYRPTVWGSSSRSGVDHQVDNLIEISRCLPAKFFSRFARVGRPPSNIGRPKKSAVASYMLLPIEPHPGKGCRNKSFNDRVLPVAIT